MRNSPLLACGALAVAALILAAAPSTRSDAPMTENPYFSESPIHYR